MVNNYFKENSSNIAINFSLNNKKLSFFFKSISSSVCIPTKATINGKTMSSNEVLQAMAMVAL